MKRPDREFAAAELLEGVDFPGELLGVALLEFEVAVEEFVAVLLALPGFIAGEVGGDDEVAGGMDVARGAKGRISGLLETSLT